MAAGFRKENDGFLLSRPKCRAIAKLRNCLINCSLLLRVRLWETSVRTPGKHEFLKSRGLDAAIDYTQTDWLPEVMRLTEGRGVELILDPLGGGHWRKSYNALRATGRLGMFGASDAAASRLPWPLNLLSVAASMPWFHPLSLMSANKAAFSQAAGHVDARAPVLRQSAHLGAALRPARSVSCPKRPA